MGTPVMGKHAEPQTMTKNLRAEMGDEAFYEFKGLFGQLDVDTNDEAIEELVSFYKEHKDD